MSTKTKAKDQEKSKTQNPTQSKSQTKIDSQEENEKIRKEKAIKLKEKQKLFSQRLEDAQSKKDYVPKPGTGKHFHVSLELLSYSKKGKKLSEPTVQVMILETFIQWLKSASRLGVAFGMAHDPCSFYTEKQREEIRQAMKSYVKDSHIESMEYGLENLAIAENSFINDTLKYQYGKKLKMIESLKAKSKKEVDYLD